MPTRDEVLAEFTRGRVTKWHSTHDMADEIVRLRQLLETVERERESVSSQLWDCTNERDGYKHRAERMERVVALVDEMFDARDYDEDMAARARLMEALTELRALDAEAQP